MSPTVLRSGPYRLFFFSIEGHEPPHIHTQRDRKLAKFWLNPVRLGSSTEFGAYGLNLLRRIVEESEAHFLEAWNDHFSS